MCISDKSESESESEENQEEELPTKEGSVPNSAHSNDESVKAGKYDLPTIKIAHSVLKPKRKLM